MKSLLCRIGLHSWDWVLCNFEGERLEVEAYVCGRPGCVHSE